MRWLGFILLLGVLLSVAAAKLRRMRGLQDHSMPIHPLMRVPVPWVFVLAYLVGVGMQFQLAPAPLPRPVVFYGYLIGMVLLVAGLALAMWCLTLFRRARTTTIPLVASSKLVTDGPYQYSRNPMYVSLTLMYLGEAGLLAQVWPIPLLLLVLIYLNWILIPFEEARLREAFGDAYKEYCGRVRRWW
jgi:protein-S-isoprenylcysteine O-methyltransferase Ste14